MAKITINPISNNYSINVPNSSYCTVALPITACWGPAFQDPTVLGTDTKTELEDTVWTRFSSNQTGLQSFVSTFRGPSANYRRTKDYSYHQALHLSLMDMMYLFVDFVLVQMLQVSLMKQTYIPFLNLLLLIGLLIMLTTLRRVERIM